MRSGKARTYWFDDWVPGLSTGLIIAYSLALEPTGQAA